MKSKEKLTEEQKPYEELRQSFSNKPDAMPRATATMKLLRFLFRTREEVEVTLSLENPMYGGKPKTAAEVAKELGKDVKEINEILERLARRGSVRWEERQEEPGVKEYYQDGSLVFDWVNHSLVPRRDVEAEEYRKLYIRYDDDIAIMEKLRLYNLPRHRVLVPDKTIAAGQKILPYETPQEIIRAIFKASKNVAIGPCSCRMTRRNCDHTLLTCLYFGRDADSVVRVTKASVGRPFEYVTEKEALKRLDESFKEGLVAQAWNIASTAENMSIHMCCTCCCTHLLPYNTGIKVTYAGRSNFEPKIDQEKCNLCDKCVDVCPAEALWHHWPHKEDSSDNFIFLDIDRCFGCGVCAYSCPQSAISMMRVRDITPPPDLATLLERMEKEARH